MKKSRTKTSLLVSASAIAGVAMGAGIALAAHPPVTLYTYEEVAQQMGFPAAPVMVKNDNKQGLPYSPKQTCFGSKDGVTKCHGDDPSNPLLKAKYSDLSEHAFHSALGFNEWMDNSTDGRLTTVDGVQTGLAANKPWVQSHGHNGKW
jgi:hypothetical protein